MLAQPLGIRLIIAYKAAKATVVGAAAVIMLASRGGAIRAPLLHLAGWIHEHASRPWAEALGEWVRRIARPRALTVIAIVLLADAALSSVEAWALRRGHAWGPWLVVIATGTLLPLEVVALARRPDAAHAVLLAINVVVVAYLSRQIRVSAPATV